MKRTKLAAISLTALLAAGCGSSSSSSDDDTGSLLTYDVENTYWDLAASATDEASRTVNVEDIIAYYFNSESDTLNIYQASGFTSSAYTITGDDSDSTLGTVEFTVNEAAVECSFTVTDSILALDACSDADYDASEIGEADADTIAELEALTEIVEQEEANQYAGITDVSADTSGSLKYDIVTNYGAELTEGAVTVDVLYPTDQDQDFAITVFDSTNTTSGSVADVVLKSDGRVQTRVAGSTTTVSGITHTPGTTSTYVITWDTETQQYTATMDGTEIFTGDFNNTAATGVAYFGVKLSSNSKVAASTSVVDNIGIYSDAAQETSVFSDDFESYALETDLSTEGTYSATEAIVGGTAASEDDSDPVDEEPIAEEGENLAAQIIDTDAGGADGELRLSLASQSTVSSITTGTVTATLMLQPDEDTANVIDDTTAVSNTAYVSLYGTGTSSSNLHGDIIFSGNKMKYRDSTGSQKTIDGLTYEDATAIDFVATWDATTYSFSIDGGDTFYGPYDSRELEPVEVISFKISDKSSVSEDEFIVDNIEVLDDGTSVYTEDFEEYEVGHDLDGDPFNNNSAEATVQEKDL